MNKLMGKLKSGKKGFTLIELVVVILIIAILAVVLIPQLSAMTNKAKTAGVQEAFREYQVAAQTVAMEQSGLPVDEFETDHSLKAGTAALMNKNLDAVNQLGTDGSTNAVTIDRKDPWGNAYSYKYTAAEETDTDSNSVVNGARVTIISNGADGVADSADDLSTTVEYRAGSVITTTDGFSLNAVDPAA